MVVQISNVATEAKYPLETGRLTVPSGTGIGRGFNTLLTDTPTAGQGTQLRELRVRDLSDFQKYMEPTETPFTSSLSEGPDLKSKRYEWATEHLTPNTAIIGTTGFNPTDATANVDIDAPGRIHPGSMILVGSEQIWVHNNAITATGLMAGRYTRGIGGTTISAHPTGTKVQVMLAAALENEDTPFRGLTRANIEWNTLQLADYGIWGSERELDIPDLEFNSGNKYDAYLERIMKETAILWEITAILGNRSAPAGTGYGSAYSAYASEYLNDPEGSTSLPTSIGGLRYFTPLTYDLQGAPINEFILELLTADSVERVGEGNTPKKLFVGKFVRMALNSLFNANRYATVKDKVTNLTWTRMIGTFGEVDFVYSRYIPDNEAYFMNTSDIKKHYRRGGAWREVVLSTAGPYKRGRFTGDLGLTFNKTNARSKIIGISDNPDDYPNLGVA